MAHTRGEAKKGVRSVCDTDDKQMLKVVGRSGASATRGGAAMMPELESVPLGQRHTLPEALPTGGPVPTIGTAGFGCDPGLCASWK